MIDLSKVPKSPGCYIYKDSEGEVIYVGKAKDLEKRVKSYFQSRDHDNKTVALINKISSVDYITTDTEVEALILENSLIKKNKPKYNINLRDSKTYAYIQVTSEDYPRLLVARSKNDKGTFYGPFTSAQDRDYVIRLLRKIFMLRTCKRLPKRACVRKDILNCLAPCINSNVSDYATNVASAIMVLNGKVSELINKLTNEMTALSGKEEFEKALVLRNQINALTQLTEKQKMDRDKKYDEDIINYVISGDTVYLVLFNSIKGVLASKHEYVFNYVPDFFEEFITQYYADNPVPKEIILPESISDSLKEYLHKLRKGLINFTVPVRGEKKDLLTLASKNIEEVFFNEVNKVKALKDELGLPKLPNVIECFDISHLAGTMTVASMIQFRNARPDKTNYRRFKLRSVVGVDDFKSINEVVSRRYSRLKREGEALPDLIVIDGGKGQLSSAINALKELKMHMPIISLAKENEEVYTPSAGPISLDKKSKGLQLLINVRDEAHRFAISYNKILRSKEIK